MLLSLLPRGRKNKCLQIKQKNTLYGCLFCNCYENITAILFLKIFSVIMFIGLNQVYAWWGLHIVEETCIKILRKAL